MRRLVDRALPVGCLLALVAACFGAVLFRGEQFAYRDSAHYYYPLYEHVQAEWDAGRIPLWSPLENGGMPLLGNPTAAVLYPGKIIYAALPYPWAARVYVVAHTLLAFAGMVALMRHWRVGRVGASIAALSFAFGVPVLFQYCNIIFLVGAAWLPLGFRAVDRWLRLGRRGAVLELAAVLAMQVLGGDLQAAYLTGLCAGGYALGLAWARRRADSPLSPARRRALTTAPVLGAVAWVMLTLLLAAWLPGLRPREAPASTWAWLATTLESFWEGGWKSIPLPGEAAATAAAEAAKAKAGALNPPSGGMPPPLPWMGLLHAGILLAWATAGLRALGRWRRGRDAGLVAMLAGLAGSAALAGMLAAAQLLPVFEFTSLTGRAAHEGPHDIYPFSLEPLRLVELAFPNAFGTNFGGNRHWLMATPSPSGHAKIWVPSLYMGGLTLLLAAGAMGLRKGPPWRIWLTSVAAISLLGAMGEYTSPIYWARCTPAGERWLGPHDPILTASIRFDRLLRDGDGGVYWLLSTALPGFRQFRYPSKLLSFTALALAALAGLGWDRLMSGRSRRVARLASGLLLIGLVALAVALANRGRIIDALQAADAGMSSLFGPLDARGCFAELIRSLGHAAVVMALGLVLALRGHRRPRLAGAAALIVVTADLAAANAQYVLTAPQSLFETVPRVLQLIQEAERDRPAPGPYRIHRMPLWDPIAWLKASSDDRVRDFLVWERDTLQPKYGLPFGVEYTMTLGVAELYDYEFFFGAFYRTVEGATARALGVPDGEKVVYHPRRSYDLWNTRYFVLPVYPRGWTEEHRGYASFLPDAEVIYPRPEAFEGPEGKERQRAWMENEDFQILRNKAEYPRAWVVRRARFIDRIVGLGREQRKRPMEEMLYQADALWNDPTKTAHDPRRVAWVEADDPEALAPYLRGGSGPNDSVTVASHGSQRVELDVTLETPGLVVLADVYYPGWRLTIDGEPAPIYRANRMMRGAAVPAGKHRLVYTYRPQSFRVGAWITAAGMASLLALALFFTRYPTSPRPLS